MSSNGAAFNLIASLDRKEALFLLADQAIGALLKLHGLRNEVILRKSPHPLLAYVTQSLVPQVTGVVGCHVYFLPTYPGMH